MNKKNNFVVLWQFDFFCFVYKRIENWLVLQLFFFYFDENLIIPNSNAFIHIIIFIIYLFTSTYHMHNNTYIATDR